MLCGLGNPLALGFGTYIIGVFVWDSAWTVVPQPLAVWQACGVLARPLSSPGGITDQLCRDRAAAFLISFLYIWCCPGNALSDPSAFKMPLTQRIP